MGDDIELRDDTTDAEDAREEDIVKDTDADTRDVEETIEDTREDYSGRFDALSATLDKILAELSSLREAQGIMVEDGMTVSEGDAIFEDSDNDGIMDADELDLTL